MYNNIKICLIPLVLLLISNNVLSKIYQRCELAKELYNIHKIPMEQLPTWICIAEHTSNLCTNPRNHLIGYGIFGIGSKYWCSLNKQRKGCNIKCSQLEDDDITDDVECIKIIYKKTSKINGNGFLAWDAYKNICQEDEEYIDNYIKGCNLGETSKDKSEEIIIDLRNGLD